MKNYVYLGRILICQLLLITFIVASALGEEQAHLPLGATDADIEASSKCFDVPLEAVLALPEKFEKLRQGLSEREVVDVLGLKEYIFALVANSEGSGPSEDYRQGFRLRKGYGLRLVFAFTRDNRDGSRVSSLKCAEVITSNINALCVFPSTPSEGAHFFLLKVEHRDGKATFSTGSGEVFSTLEELRAYCVKILNEFGNSVPLAVVVDRHTDFDALFTLQDAIYSTGLSNVDFVVHPNFRGDLKLILFNPWAFSLIE